MSRPIPLPRRIEDTKKNRTRAASWAPATGRELHDGILTVHTTGQPDERHAVTRFPADLSGRAYRVLKCVVGAEAYDVLIGDRPACDLCDCKGFIRYGYCKHTDSLRALIAAGRLPDEQDNPEAGCGDFREDAEPMTAEQFDRIVCDY